MFSRCAWAPLVGALRAHWTDWTDWTGQTGWTGWTGRSGLDGLDWTDWKVMLVCIHACVYTQALYMFPTHTTCMFPIHAMKLFILDSEWGLICVVIHEQSIMAPAARYRLYVRGRRRLVNGVLRWQVIFSTPNLIEIHEYIMAYPGNHYYLEIMIPDPRPGHYGYLPVWGCMQSISAHEVHINLHIHTEYDWYTCQTHEKWKMLPCTVIISMVSISMPLHKCIVVIEKLVS